MRWLIFLLMLTGCSGYRFSQQENPLSQYGIQSLSVPMFYNYSNLSEASGDFTRETYRLLTGFSGLKLHNGYKSSSDAILIGIIKSPEKLYDTLNPSNLRSAETKAPNAVGSRKDFYIPGTTDVNLYLQVIVIKKPSEEELSLLKSGIGDQVRTNSKIIFNETIPLRMTYTREILDQGPDENGDGLPDRPGGVQVNATQNFGVQRKTVRALAEQAAVQVRDMIFYAF